MSLPKRKRFDSTNKKFMKNKKHNTGKKKDSFFFKTDDSTKKEDFDDEIESESDLETNDVGNGNVEAESEDDAYETAQEKKVRLAKLYLEEIERKEQELAEEKAIEKEAVSKYLQDEIREKSDRYKKLVADNYVGIQGDIVCLKCKEHKLPITCVVVSADNKYIFSAAKDGSIVKWLLSERRKVNSIARKKGAVVKGHTVIYSLALSYDSKFLASTANKNINIWNADNLDLIQTLSKHTDIVTGLAFRKNSHQLYSVSNDKSVKIWNIDEMSYIESLFGHQTGITSVDCLSAERAVTSGGGDCSVRVWKVVEESQLVYNGHSASIECVKFIADDHFVTCGADGDLCLWSTMKKKPLSTISHAHGVTETGEPNWIVSVTSMVNTDLLASGSCNGEIKLWKCGNKFRSLEHKFDIPVVGFVNAMAFTSDGNYLVVAAGQEHRLGRWWRNKEAKNCVLIVPLCKKE